MPLSLRVALYLLVFDGVSALYLGDFLDGRWTVAIGGVLLLSWWAEGLARRLGRALGLGRVLAPLAAAAFLVDYFYLAETVLDALVRLLLFLVAYKLFTLRSVKDTRTVSFLAFFMLVAASSSAFGVGFLFVFLAFVVLAAWVTLQQHVLLESETTPRRALGGVDAGAWSGPALFRLACVASAGIVALTAGLFFVLPRVGLAALPLRARLGQMVTGFSDRVELGSYGSIATDPTIVMRVQVPDTIRDPDALPNLRWRGVALDEFDGRVWSMRYPRRVRTYGLRGGDLEVGLLQGRGPVLHQEVYLEPIGTEAIFAAPRVLRLGIRANAVAIDDMGGVSVPPPTARLHYVVESQLEPPPEPGARFGRAPEELDAADRVRYLQLPPLPARIPALARREAAGSHDAYEAALRLTRILRRDYRYTLTTERQTALDPLEEFLFVRRAGHCEYFAAALAVMLRSLGIPARVVNGFQRGEWNPYGHYFIVRLRDAHSWVEAYVDGLGWVSFDPTPRATVESTAWGAPTATFLYLDALRLQWHRYVINWSIRDQIGVARAFQRRASAWGPWLAALREGSGPRRAGWTAMALAGLGLLGLAWWRAKPRAAQAGAGRPPRFYERALRVLARRGLRPAAGETAREFGARVERLGPTWAAAFARVTAAYERCRFGAARLTPAEAAEVEACVAALRHPGRPPRAAS